MASQSVILPTSQLLVSRETSNSNLLTLDCIIESDHLIDGVLQVASHIKPQWPKTQLKHKIFKDGITNKLVGVYCENDDSDMVLVRIYGKHTEWMINRAVEIENIEILQSVGLAAPLYASFINGLAYKYLPGKTLDTQTCRDERIYPKVAKLMALYHKQLDYYLKKSTLAEIGGHVKTVLWEKIERFLNLIPNFECDDIKDWSYRMALPSKEEFIEDLKWMEKQVEKLNSPIVFCHNDLLLANILYDESNDKMHFIDFEYAGPNYQAYDIANHFCEFAGVEDAKHCLYPDEDFRRKWISIYLQTFHENKHITDEDVDLLLIQVEHFAMVSHFFWGIWSIIQATHSTIAFDFVKYGRSRLEQFAHRKNKLYNKTYDHLIKKN